MRKLAWFELEKGRLAVDGQDVFEEIQKASFEANDKATMTVRIEVFPPKDEEHGGVKYSISKAMPQIKSAGAITKIQGGFIITGNPNKPGLLAGNRLDFTKQIEGEIVDADFEDEPTPKPEPKDPEDEPTPKPEPEPKDPNVIDEVSVK